MSLLFADVYDGIRTVRIQKGVCEKDILNYVQEKVGGCMKVSNVLKTIRTIKQLCQDGVLIKKGKRYAFAPKCNKPCEDDDEEDDENEEEEEFEMEPDNCEERDDGEEEEEEEDDGEDEEDEEEDDDEEEEDEDEDDDDKDDECNEKDDSPGGGEEKRKISNEEQKEVDETGNEKNGNINGNNCADKKINRGLIADDRYEKKKASEKAGKRENKPDMDQDGESKKGNEAIAFCVRDFIDSLGRPNALEKQEERRKSEEVQENMDGANIMELGKTQPRKRALRNKRKPTRQSSHLSKSSRKEGEIGMFHSLAQGHSVETGLRAVNSEFFQEPGNMDVDMDVDMEKDTAFEVHHRASAGPASLNLLSGVDTLCMETEKKILENVKTENSFEDLTERVEKNSSHTSQVQTTTCQIPQMTWFPLEDNDKDPEEPRKRAESTDDDNQKSESLCSVCEKKKRSS